MKKRMLLISILLLGLFLVAFKKVNNTSSHIVLESTTNTIIKGSNYNEQMLVASTAKILTAIVVIENYDLDEEIEIKKEYTYAIGSSVYLKENDLISRKDLLYALMLRSANDAAYALSSSNSNEFIVLMNELAKKIGMRDSIFTNASGLDEEEYNLSTAYDMALLTSYAIKNKTFVDIASTHRYSCKTKLYSYNFINKHKLVINNEEFLLGKTGYTRASKRVLVSNYVKDNKNLVIVTINDSDDWSHHLSLANCEEYSFADIVIKGIYEIYLDKKYYIVIKNNIVLPIKTNKKDNISLKYYINSNTEYNDSYLEIYENYMMKCRIKIAVFDDDNFNYEMLL